MTIPPGAFPECSKFETAAMKRPDGQDASAFASRAKALAAMRDAAIDQEARLAVLEAKLANLPFPFNV